MAGPFQFKTLKDIYSESISGTNSAFNAESIDLQNQLKKNSEQKSIGGYTATAEKRFNYIRKNQDNLLKYFKSPEGLEFIAKQELLYKSAQYLAPVTPGQALAGFVPGIPVVSSVLNSITGNYNIHRDFVITNMIEQIGLSSLGMQGKQANFANRISDFKLSSLASLFAPAISPSTQKVYTAYIDDITGRNTNLVNEALNFFTKKLGIGDGINSDKDRLVKLYNQLTNNPSERAKDNLDYEFNQRTRNKSEGIFGAGSFYNVRSERHRVSKPATSNTQGEFTDNVKEYWGEFGIGPLEKASTLVDALVKATNSRKKPFSIVESYSSKLEKESDTKPIIDYYFSGVRGEKLKDSKIGDILSNRVLEDNVSVDDKKDLIRFSIEFGLENYKNSKHIQFRAFLNDITDNNSANYSSTRYIGRADQVHVYEGFTRTIGLGFTIYSRNPDEQKIVFQKLNTLTSLLTPSYSVEQTGVKRTFSDPPDAKPGQPQQVGTIENILGGIPRAPIIKLTIGNYINGQYGFITNLTYNIKNANMWDIDNELPHIIEVSSFSFTPIHDFVVSQGKNNDNISWNDNRFIYIENPNKVTAKDIEKDVSTSTLSGGTGNLPSQAQTNLDTQISNIITPFN
jgi:hypothetical protein